MAAPREQVARVTSCGRSLVQRGGLPDRHERGRQQRARAPAVHCEAPAKLCRALRRVLLLLLPVSVVRLVPVEAVAAALRRWEVCVAGDFDDLFGVHVGGGGDGTSATISVSGEDRTALLATLGPLLAALPPSQFSGVAVTGLPGLSAEEMVRLGGALPGCMARVRLRLEGRLEGEACAALVPSLPATVGEVALAGRVGGAGVGGLDEQQLMLVCLGAARGVTLRAAVAEQAAGAAERVGRLMALLGRAHVVDVREL